MKPHVLHVVPAAPGGGTSSFIEHQIAGLTGAGIASEVEIFSGSALIGQPGQLPAAVRALRRRINRASPNLVHAHWGSLLGAATVLATRRTAPIVLTFRGSDLNPVPSENKLKSAIRLACSQFGARGAAAIITVSPALAARIWRPRWPPFVIPDGTDLAMFSPRPRSSARAALGWQADEPVLLFYAGRSPMVKRLDLATRVAEIVSMSLPRLRFEVIRGDVPIEQMPLWLSAADCLLMTSDYEGSPNVVREALVCGLPVASVPVGDVQRWLTDLAGTRIVARDPTALAGAVVGLITAGIRPQASHLVDQFSLASSISAVIRVYETLSPRLEPAFPGRPS